MNLRRRAERDARRREQAIRAAAFNADALRLADLFPELAESQDLDREGLVAVAWGSGLTLKEDAPGLLLTCTYSTAWGSPVMQGRDLTYTQVLDLIRAGGLVPGCLELVLGPAGATGAWSLDQAERIRFLPGEWWLVGWKHRGESRMARVHEQLNRLGMEIEPGPPSIEMRFRLVSKVQDVARKRLIAAQGRFTPVTPMN